MHALIRRITHRTTTCTLAAVLVAAVLTACTPSPDLKASLTSTAETFYADILAGKDALATWPGVEAFNELIPIPAPAIAAAKVIAVTAPAGRSAGGNWQVKAEMRAGAQGPSVTYVEISTWRHQDQKWELISIDGREAKIHGWGELSGLEQGLAAFGHDGRIWLLDTGTGLLTQLRVDAGQTPLLLAGWAPDGSGLLLETELEWFWYQPGDAAPRSLGTLGPGAGVTWSSDGRYAAIDTGTCVVREAHIFDAVECRIVGSVATYYEMIWGPEPGTFVFCPPENVTPILPAGDGTSSSVAIGRIGGAGVETIVLVAGTNPIMYRPAGYGRDGALYYTGRDALSNGPGAALWWRWDAAASEGVPLPDGTRPEIESREHFPTIIRPPGLAGTETAAVSISPGGRWGLFHSQSTEWGPLGIYVIDLINPESYRQIAAGYAPAWRPAQR